MEDPLIQEFLNKDCTFDQMKNDPDGVVEQLEQKRKKEREEEAEKEAQEARRVATLPQIMELAEQTRPVYAGDGPSEDGTIVQPADRMVSYANPSGSPSVSPPSPGAPNSDEGDEADSDEADEANKDDEVDKAEADEADEDDDDDDESEEDDDDDDDDFDDGGEMNPHMLLRPMDQGDLIDYAGLLGVNPDSLKTQLQGFYTKLEETVNEDKYVGENSLLQLGTIYKNVDRTIEELVSGLNTLVEGGVRDSHSDLTSKNKDLVAHVESLTRENTQLKEEKKKTCFVPPETVSRMREEKNRFKRAYESECAKSREKDDEIRRLKRRLQ